MAWVALQQDVCLQVWFCTTCIPISEYNGRTMCDIKRRSLLLETTAALAAAAQDKGKRTDAVNVVDPVTEGVYFHVGDIQKEGHCNNGWIILRDYVLGLRCKVAAVSHFHLTFKHETPVKTRYLRHHL